MRRCTEPSDLEHCFDWLYGTHFFLVVNTEIRSHLDTGSCACVEHDTLRSSHWIPHCLDRNPDLFRLSRALALSSAITLPSLLPLSELCKATRGSKGRPKVALENEIRIAMLKRRERPEPNVCMKNGKNPVPKCMLVLSLLFVVFYYEQ